MMIDEATLADRFIGFYSSDMRESILAQLRAQGVQAPEARANEVIAATARAVAPTVFDQLHENLRRQYADTPEYLSLLMAPDDTPEHQPRADFIAGALDRRAKAREWLDYQVAAAIQRMNADDLNIQPEARY
jgi:hypothetical protein